MKAANNAIKAIRDKDAASLKAELVDLKKEQFNLRFQQATGQLEKSVDGHDVILKWETGDNDQTNCLTDVSLKGGESLFRSLIPFEACTAENVASSLEGTKKMLSASAPSWQTEVLDQFIAELRR